MTPSKTHSPFPQVWHDAEAVRLLHSAKGDLMLNGRGDICTRNIWTDDYKEVAWKDHTPGMVLAEATTYGFTITASGADYILENCPPRGLLTTKRLRSLSRFG